MRAAGVSTLLPLTALAMIAVHSVSAEERPADDDAKQDQAKLQPGPWKVLYLGRRSRGVRPLPSSGPLKPLDDLKFVGAHAGHPFYLGHFATDGRWGVVNGGLQRIEGKNAAFRIARADSFELEGRAQMEKYGGWFLLVGWDQGRGYAVSSATMKVSGSPWFLCEFRGDEAIEETDHEYDGFEWRDEQPFRVRVVDRKLTFEIGGNTVLDQEELANYSEGDIIFGVYDTRYGPRPVRIRALRIRAFE
ncbi:hypothetical protein Mal4_51530 [Maioricimonas rarisocia]|uniref:3-keto-disaccharide hydrolase domain-containing protein n=1 Tax=Maioricimonas rarisocia TaxID=2528026 RepID=A0A517ZE85_9PLAN|nr:hypothetical protein [Maioricimonas rarisocia]QDU40793.1 hypothetical protein Mal4_51530 [Maioricimonas rarisocia]